MNIGSVKPTKGGYLGAIATMALDAAIAFVPVTSSNPRAPRFEVQARNAAKRWVQIGAVWEQASQQDGTVFLTGKLDDPSMSQPLYIAAFEQQDGSYNIVWSRPQRQDSMGARDTETGSVAGTTGSHDNPFADGVDINIVDDPTPAGDNSKGRRAKPAMADDLNDKGPF